MAESSFASICSRVRGAPSEGGGGWLVREVAFPVVELLAATLISAVAPLTSDTAGLFRALRPERLAAGVWPSCAAANASVEADAEVLVAGGMSVGCKELCPGRLELHKAEFLPAAHQGAQQREGRRSRLDNNIEDHLEDERGDGELGIVGLAAQRDVEIDLSLAVFEQGDGELDRQVGGVGAVIAGTESEMIDQELVLRLELLLVDVVVQPHRELAFVQGMAGVSLHVGRKGCKVRVRESDRQVQVEVLGQRIDFAGNGERRGRVHLATEIDRGRARSE